MSALFGRVKRVRKVLMSDFFGEFQKCAQRAFFTLLAHVLLQSPRFSSKQQGIISPSKKTQSNNTMFS